MASVFNIAECILSETGYVSTMKLQKLTFYSQAYSLASDGRALFDDDFQAWANGPVCPKLFNAHKGLFVIGPEDLRGKGQHDSISAQDKSVVNHIIDTLGHLNGNQLSSLTHSERPWIDARKGCSEGDRCSTVITKQAMRSYYSSSLCANAAFADLRQ